MAVLALSFALPGQHPRLADELSRALGPRGTLDDIPDAELDRLAEMGFDWVWLLERLADGPAASSLALSTRSGGGNSQETLPIS